MGCNAVCTILDKYFTYRTVRTVRLRNKHLQGNISGASRLIPLETLVSHRAEMLRWFQFFFLPT